MGCFREQPAPRQRGNLTAVLHRLEQRDVRRSELVCQQIGRILPGFDRFDMEEDYGKVLLSWRAKWSQITSGAHLTSDGSLRFFPLVTLLNLPPEMLPDLILLDEPELRLHPAALALICGMIESLSKQRQVIVATQSPLLVDSNTQCESTIGRNRGGSAGQEHGSRS